MNEKIATVKNFLKRNERRILGTAIVVTTTVAVVEGKAISSLNEFLKENDLFDKYYTTDED